MNLSEMLTEQVAQIFKVSKEFVLSDKQLVEQMEEALADKMASPDAIDLMAKYVYCKWNAEYEAKARLKAEKVREVRDYWLNKNLT